MGKQRDKGVSTEMLAKAMTHPLRREIIRHMRETGVPIAAVEVGVAIMRGRQQDTQLASYHVGRLEEFGLVEPHHEERVRGTIKTYYILTGAAKAAASPTAQLAEAA
jgi:hypothetical protein